MKIKKFYTAIVSVLLAVCLALPMAACAGGETPASMVELDRSTLTLNIGEEETLTYTVLPQDAVTGPAKWLSSAPDVVTVTNGVVRGIKDGKAAIRVSIGNVHADCSVTVIDPSKVPVAATGISLSNNTLKLAVGGTSQLTATVEPANATDKTVSWSSSNATVATVQNGFVTAVGGGSAVITAKTSNNFSANCVVTVEGEAAGSELYVAEIPSLRGREDFIMAMDSSELLSLEAAREENGLTFKDFEGNEADVLQVLKDNGITDIRIRVWNDPYDSTDVSKRHGYGGGNCDVDNAVELSKRCEKVGLGVIIDFHYSDFWADPGKQKAPKAWENMEIDDKAEALGTFTKDALTKIKATGVSVTMVQVGNETTGGMAGETGWTNICKLMNAGSAAIRKVTPEAKIAVHFTNAGDNTYLSKAQTLSNNQVDYDVFGTSWYPYYTSHGTLSNLTSQLKSVHDTYHKDVMVLETAYAFTREDLDGCGNTPLEQTTQPITVQGMSNAVREVIAAIADLGDYGLGVSYWGGTWVPASDDPTGSVNRQLCKDYGCGWATSYAHGYDSSANDGGSQVDNNAFFLPDGTPIEALKMFNYVKEGHTTNLRADYLEDQEIYYTVNVGQIELPTTVKVVLNNGSALELNAIWNIEQAELTNYIRTVNMYTVQGTTLYGGTCYCYVWVMNVNLLSEGSFENFDSYGDSKTQYVQSDIGDWNLKYTRTENLQLFVSNNTGNARIGTNSFHFWDDRDVNFDLYQTLDVSQLKDYGNGKYGCSFDFQGADGVNIDIHAYITVTYKDGRSVTTEGTKAEMNGWQNWSRTSISGLELDLSEITSITVGIHVKADFSGAGPWGNIDNCQFYFEG